MLAFEWAAMAIEAHGGLGNVCGESLFSDFFLNLGIVFNRTSFSTFFLNMHLLQRFA
jgi:hypothetical protein